MLINKFSDENQAKITLLVKKLDFIMFWDAPSLEFVKRLLTRNSLVHMCLFLYDFLQQISKNCVAANAVDCIDVQHLINT